ncbi:hypothetical protein [Paraglaciecola sp. L1A13]|uniref:hypothetical protein n=1 Tax=Paraglaciecola sp. L1A13 TaxID=2686359 RepID=UPI00131CC1ED|nr:hypothetical protein [Paraglaciecola sp. L1A13]
MTSQNLNKTSSQRYIYADLDQEVNPYWPKAQVTQVLPTRASTNSILEPEHLIFPNTDIPLHKSIFTRMMALFKP